jgi:hypothetical protein
MLVVKGRADFDWARDVVRERRLHERGVERGV